MIYSVVMEFQEMFNRIVSSVEFSRMKRFLRPMEQFLGIQHFWYYRIEDLGFYTYFGTHIPWSEYCFENIDLLEHFSELFHEGAGLSLMKKLDIAWNKFGINFCLNFSSRTETGIEAFGFATKHPSCEKRVLNELPMIEHFLKLFKKENQKLFEQATENQVSFPLVKQGSRKETNLEMERLLLLKKMDLLPLELTRQERRLLSYMKHGFTSGYIANEMKLSNRTVENYIVNIKEKLFCTSKSELIFKAQELNAFGYLQ